MNFFGEILENLNISHLEWVQKIIKQINQPYNSL